MRKFACFGLICGSLILPSVASGAEPRSSAVGRCKDYPFPAEINGHFPLFNENVNSTGFPPKLWKAFVAMLWPADPKRRGVPLNPGDSQVLGRRRLIPVWHTWKQDWETFASAPTPFESYETAQPPCDEILTMEGNRIPVTAENWPSLYLTYGNRALLNKISQLRSVKRANLPFETFGAAAMPGRNYIFNELRYNKPLYDCIVFGSGEGCTKETDSKISYRMPATDSEMRGSIAAQASWVLLEPGGSFGKGAHTQIALALHYDEEGRRVCRQGEYALLGVDISIKNKYIFTRGLRTNKWIWGTFIFEGVVPSCTSESGMMAKRGFDRLPDLDPPCRRPLPSRKERVPIRLCEVSPDPSPSDAIFCINQNYHKALEEPLSSYRLELFQWLLSGKPNPPSDVANPVVEPFSQHSSCMQCHQEFESGHLAPSRFDHVLSLAINQLPDLPCDKIFYYGSTWLPERAECCLDPALEADPSRGEPRL